MLKITKWISLLLILSSVFALCACSDTKKSDSNATESQKSTTEGNQNILNQIESVGKENAEVEIGAYVPVGEDVLEWEDSENGVTLTGYTGTETVIELPAQINGKALEAIGDYAFTNTQVVAVKLPDTVTRIGYQSFMFVMTLSKVELGSGTQLIEASAFEGCSALTEIVLNEGIHTIEGRVFAMCSALPEINLPRSLTSMGKGVFCLASSLKEITIPGGVAMIDEQAFTTCSSLEKVVLEDGVTTLEYGAFEVCEALTEVHIPASVTDISTRAFSNSNSVTIYTSAGSAAETFAKEEGIPCVIE